MTSKLTVMEATGRWTRLEPDERRRQIFGCAIRLFGERPYAEVSTTDIAREAGVARGLINHYFDTKRNLYLQVVRRMVTIPAWLADSLPTGDLCSRVDASVTWFLDTIARHSDIWLAVGAGTIGNDSDVERILAEADEQSAERVLEAIGLAEVDDHRGELRAAIRSYTWMAKAAGREWLQRGSLTREQAHLLLTGTLLGLARETLPTLRERGTAP